MRLTLVRHAQTAWNREGRAQGHTEVPLDETGRWQALRLAERLAESRYDWVLSSDLGRCRETLAPFLAASGLVAEYLAALRERSFGSMEGVDYALLHESLLEESLRTRSPFETVRPPGGESVLDVRERVAPIVRRLFECGGGVLVVSHGGTLAQLLSMLIKGTWETARSFRFANASVTELSLRPSGAFVVERFNDAAHLEGSIEAAGVT